MSLIDEPRENGGRRIDAIAISRGIGVGNVVFLDSNNSSAKHERIEIDRVADEVKRFETAVQTSTRELRSLAAENNFDPNAPVAAIFAFHLSIVEDSSFVGRVAAAIQDQLVNAEWAVSSVADHYRERQIAVMDDRFREKHLDIADVAERIIAALRDAASVDLEVCRGAVVAARELRPSQVVEIARYSPAAFVTERGGWTSHASIVARELKIPMVSGVKNLHEAIPVSTRVEIDGNAGTVVVDPTLDRTSNVPGREIVDGIHKATEHAEVTTLDGVPITIRANADTVERFRVAAVNGARGIGLFRSESLLGMRSELPSEDEQVDAYAAIADAAGADGVSIRTFDIGPERFHKTAERNSALGLRAIRWSLSNTASFRTQIRALLRASNGRSIKIILPLIAGVAEVEAATAIIRDEKANLSNLGIALGHPGLGVMIEVPSAVLTIDQIIERVDFVCLGTNDLVQYLLAVDRDNDAVAEYYQSLHPAVIRALKRVIDASTTAGKPCILCGEMAASPFYVPVLIGLGARELSINVDSIPRVIDLVRSLNIAVCEQIAARLEKFSTAQEAEAFLKTEYSRLFPDRLSLDRFFGQQS